MTGGSPMTNRTPPYIYIHTRTSIHCSSIYLIAGNTHPFVFMSMDIYIWINT